MMEHSTLAAAALQARARAHCPYSGFAVGAALLGESGRVYMGCNVENAAYSATCCAERVALFKAVSEGERGFCALAVAGGAREDAPPLTRAVVPCGVCLQALSEFCGGELPVLLVRSPSDMEHTTLGALLPARFTGRSLSGAEQPL